MTEKPAWFLRALLAITNREKQIGEMAVFFVLLFILQLIIFTIGLLVDVIPNPDHINNLYVLAVLAWFALNIFILFLSLPLLILYGVLRVVFILETKDNDEAYFKIKNNKISYVGTKILKEKKTQLVKLSFLEKENKHLIKNTLEIKLKNFIILLHYSFFANVTTDYNWQELYEQTKLKETKLEDLLCEHSKRLIDLDNLKKNLTLFMAQEIDLEQLIESLKTDKTLQALSNITIEELKFEQCIQGKVLKNQDCKNCCKRTS